ncbi:MAG: lipid-A-disaccharide synthase [Parachlamydiales bacterium]|nr:lipid-A-disaccharide synthase [Parachlamydiales bacterium]
MIDLFVATGEMSGDINGAKLIAELLKMRPDLKIGAVAGPEMRKLPIQSFFRMESLKVMGFIDILPALPKLIWMFFSIRNKILKLQPKAAVFIDYPGLHLRLERSLRKKGYQGKLIHFICPTVWAWGKKRIPLMAQNLDLLLTLFPFEKACFANTSLNVQYVGHPLALPISQFKPTGKFSGKILAIFPGSRKTEIERNLPLQLKIARRLKALDPSLQIAISKTQYPIDAGDAIIVPPEDSYELMRSCRLALATSGTVTLELALHGTPTVVCFAIRQLDLFLAQKIFHIDLPFYALPNIVAGDAVFPELFGPNFTEAKLFFWAEKLLNDPGARARCLNACQTVQNILGRSSASREAAEAILQISR